jgi:hypothetical protein
MTHVRITLFSKLLMHSRLPAQPHFLIRPNVSPAYSPLLKGKAISLFHSISYAFRLHGAN